jgi:hypothetical protein
VAFLVFTDQAAADRVVNDLLVTANIAGGTGPTKIGTLARLADGRLVAAHPFEAVDLDWIVIYADEAGLSVMEELG